METKKLYNFLGDYDGRKQGTFDLTVKEFQSNLQRVLPDSDLCLLEEEDWVALFDDELNAAISEAQWRLSHPEEKKKPESKPQTDAAAVKNPQPASRKTFLIADTHFGDERIRKYENRPFDDVKQMDAELISRWNKTVSPEDRIYVLGDFGADGYEQEVLAQLKGEKYLIKGNHDQKSNEEYRKCGFREVYDYPIIVDNFWIMSHDALYVNENMPYANLFGHVHNSPIVKDYSSQHYCVCVERIDYTPIDFDLVKKTIAQGGKTER